MSSQVMRELEQAFHVAVKQLADDVVDVSSRAERATSTSDDNHTNILLLPQRSERIS